MDNSEVELSIVRALLSDASFTRLVDEFLFEYHFAFDGVNFGWENTGDWRGHTADEALKVMRRLREAGVRAHFWI